MQLEDDLRRRLDAHDQLFRSLRMKKVLTSIGPSYEYIQSSLAKAARPAFIAEMERVVAQTYQFGTKMAEIARATQRDLDAIARPITGIAASVAGLRRQWGSFDADLSSVFTSTEKAMQSIVGLEGLWRQNLSIPDVYSQLTKSSTFEHFPALRVAALAIRLPEFDTTFLGSLYKRLELLHESGATVEPAMAEVESTINERADSLNSSWVNFKWMVDILYPILLLVFHLWYAGRSEQRTSTEMRHFIESQLRRIETHMHSRFRTLDRQKAETRFMWSDDNVTFALIDLPNLRLLVSCIQTNSSRFTGHPASGCTLSFWTT